MALTITNLKPVKLSNLKGAIADITFDDAYPAAGGGLSLTPGQLGLNVIDYLGAESASGYTFEYDRANNKLIAYTAGAEPASGSLDLSAVITRVFAVGW